MAAQLVLARSGLGSSSSFTVGLLHAIQAQNGRMSSRNFLATEAIRIEQNVIKEHVGSQDQIWAAYGGMNRIDFQRDGSFSVDPVIMPEESRRLFSQYFMLVFTGLSRYASVAAAKKIANLDKRAGHIEKMVAMVDQAQAILGRAQPQITDIGHLLNEGWRLKRELADSVSTPEIDEIYQNAIDAGAIGGKLLGAGGGGFMAFFVEPEKQAKVRERLSKLIQVEFDIEYSGSKVVLYEPNGL